MKNIFLSLLLISFLPLSFFCKGNPHNINVKRDFEYMYNVIEKCFKVAVKHVKKKKINKGLTIIEKYVKKESNEIKMVGVRLNSIILTEKESFNIIRFNEKYTKLTSKYISYLERHFNNKQKDRFVTVVVEGVAKKFVDQLIAPKNSTDFFKKAIR